MNYTKGEWRALPSGIGGIPYYVETSDLNIAQISGVRSKDEARANAFLCAAAPLMYEALKEALILLDKQRDEYNLSLLPRDKVGEGPIASKARKALAKAEGRVK